MQKSSRWLQAVYNLRANSHWLQAVAHVKSLAAGCRPVSFTSEEPLTAGRPACKKCSHWLQAVYHLRASSLWLQAVAQVKSLAADCRPSII